MISEYDFAIAASRDVPEPYAVHRRGYWQTGRRRVIGHGSLPPLKNGNAQRFEPRNAVSRKASQPSQ